MTGPARRIDPRRPYRITPDGRKRIVLGERGGTIPLPVPVHRAAGPKPLRLTEPPSANLLAIVHSDRGALDTHALEAIAAAALLAGRATAVAVLVLGDLSQDLSAAGADSIFVASACGKEYFAPDVELAVASDLIVRLAPLHIIVPDNALGDGDLGRRLAARLGADVAAHVIELRTDGVAASWRGGAQIARRGLPKLLLLDPGTTETDLPFRGAGAVTRLDTAVRTPGPYADLGSPAIDTRTLPLEEADFIVAAGNGVSDVESIEALAGMFGAAVGASRVAVDDGKFRRDQQVGATGKTVSASVYMAIGISGAVQHLQGIRACRHVIAINTDANAPIAKRADLVVVADAATVISELIAARRGRNSFVPAVPND